jgi:hypothetical protein
MSSRFQGGHMSGDTRPHCASACKLLLGGATQLKGKWDRRFNRNRTVDERLEKQQESARTLHMRGITGAYAASALMTVKSKSLSPMRALVGRKYSTQSTRPSTNSLRGLLSLASWSANASCSALM